jgi:hypothetical protein
MAFTSTEQNIIKREKILKAFTSMNEGEDSTYAALAEKVGYPLPDANRDSQFVWASENAYRKGVVIKHNWGTTTFRRLTKEEIAMDTSRAKRIRSQAKRGLNEVSVAMASNDKNVQSVASAKAARFSLIRDTAPTSNRKLVGDMI